ncbi:MAG: hypothetical protein PW843_18765 [Azospirillaceae bacterium]|nr:hypothetical protein [Azospirillaceae bacterium]
MPGDAADLFGWCVAQPQEVLLDLLAYLAASTVDAVQHGGQERSQLAHADRLARALSLDMAAHWAPGADGFYARLSRAQLAQAAQEAGVVAACGNLSAMKKADAVRRVAGAMAPTGWLPVPLRSPEVLQVEAMAA